VVSCGVDDDTDASAVAKAIVADCAMIEADHIGSTINEVIGDAGFVIDPQLHH
jgi:hypothetical protein